MAEIHTPLGINSREAVALGEQFGEQFDAYDETGRLDSERIIKQLGGTCVRAVNDLQYNDSELLSIYDEGLFKVFYGINTTRRLDNIRYAQALGHYELHFLMARQAHGGTPRQAIFRIKEEGCAYAEAYNFALGLTMHSERLEWQLEAVRGRAADVVDRLNVPRYAVDQRMRQLGLSTHSSS